jgi:hypothetical protein
LCLSDEMLYMYYLANKGRLSCFFMLDYFDRDYLFKIIEGYSTD